MGCKVEIFFTRCEFDYYGWSWPFFFECLLALFIFRIAWYNIESLYYIHTAKTLIKREMYYFICLKGWFNPPVVLGSRKEEEARVQSRLVPITSFSKYRYRQKKISGHNVFDAIEQRMKKRRNASFWTILRSSFSPDGERGILSNTFIMSQQRSYFH